MRLLRHPLLALSLLLSPSPPANRAPPIAHAVGAGGIPADDRPVAPTRLSRTAGDDHPRQRWPRDRAGSRSPAGAVVVGRIVVAAVDLGGTGRCGWPRWRNFASVAYDSDRGVLVVHGGLQGRSAPCPRPGSGTARRGDSSARRGPAGVRVGHGVRPGPEGHPALRRGQRGTSAVLGDTWAWDGSRWRLLTEDGPGGRFPGLMQFDQAHNTVVLYGGHVLVDRGPPAVSDTWIWNGQRWRRADADSPPGPRVNTGSVFHERLGRVLMIGGGDGVRPLTTYGPGTARPGPSWTPTGCHIARRMVWPMTHVATGSS